MRSLFSFGQNSDDEQTSEISEESRKEMSRGHLEEYAPVEMYYCELCNTVFPTGDTFYDHREASEYEIAKRGEESFEHVQKLTQGDTFPDGATVAAHTPCEPTSTNS